MLLRLLLEHVGVLQIAGNVGQEALQSQEFLPEVERLAVGRGFAPVGLNVGLGLEHLFLADALEVAFQAVAMLGHVEQGGDDFGQALGALDGQGVPVAQFDEVLQAHVVEVRGDDVVDLVWVEFAVRI